MSVLSEKITLKEAVIAIAILSGVTVGGSGISDLLVGQKHSVEERVFIEAVHDAKVKEDAETFTAEDIAVMDREREEDEQLRKKITSTEEAVAEVVVDVEKLKTDVENIRTVQTQMAEDVGKLVRAIPDP